MSADKQIRSCVRPQTVDRDRMLDTVMMACRAKGVNKVSVNEICGRGDVYFEDLVRECGNENVLMKAALT